MSARGRPLRPGRGASPVPAVALVLGLVLGGTLGWRAGSASQQARAPRAATATFLRSVSGPVGELRELGELAVIDRDSRVHAVAADGRSRRVLGHAGELAFAPAPERAAPGAWQRARVDGGGEIAYGLADDGAPVAVRLAGGRAERLAGDGLVAGRPPLPAADRSAVAVCAAADATAAPPEVTSPSMRGWIEDRSGRRLAEFPGCALDLAGDGKAALLPELVRRDPPGQGSEVAVTAGLRLWRSGDRAGGGRPVLSRSEAVELLRTVSPAVTPDAVRVVDATLSPDARRALVLLTHEQPERPGMQLLSGTTLVILDLEGGGWELVPASGGVSAFDWSPRGGYAYAEAIDPSRGQASSLFWRRIQGVSTGSLLAQAAPGGPPSWLEAGQRPPPPALSFSPDGGWLFVPGPSWTFIRVDDPAVRVVYDAPGEFAGWLAGSGR